MESAARRLCVAVLMDHSPASLAAPFWPIVHGEARIPLPARPQLVELLTARGTPPTESILAVERRTWSDRDELTTMLRRQLWTAPGSGADARLVAAVAELAVTADDGSVSIPTAGALEVGVLTWWPHESR
ncbi:MAG: hypothetical protein EPO36_13335 [Chloroflexota bacterium]|nr:MAG: hypothetical protein EPO36_13335 [Chloroflexota bacterium]